MAQLNKQDDLSVAIQVNGETLISSENSILYEEISNDSALLYIKSKDGSKEVKIKITKNT